MRSFPARWCAAVLVFSVLLASLLAAPAPPTASAQDGGGGAILNIDSPIEGQTFPAGSWVVYTGWAAHSAGPGTGVDRVVILDGVIDGGDPPPNIVAEGIYGVTRDDVRAVNPAWTSAGFEAKEKLSTPGYYMRWLYAHSVSNNGWTNKVVSFTVSGSVSPTPRPAMSG